MDDSDALKANELTPSEENPTLPECDKQAIELGNDELCQASGGSDGSKVNRCKNCGTVYSYLLSRCPECGGRACYSDLFL